MFIVTQQQGTRRNFLHFYMSHAKGTFYNFMSMWDCKISFVNPNPNGNMYFCLLGCYIYLESQSKNSCSVGIKSPKTCRSVRKCLRNRKQLLCKSCENFLFPFSGNVSNLWTFSLRSLCQFHLWNNDFVLEVYEFACLCVFFRLWLEKRPVISQSPVTQDRSCIWAPRYWHIFGKSKQVSC